MALTLPDASKLALADKLNGGKSRWQPRFLVYEDSAGTPVLTPLTDTVCVLDSVNFAHRAVRSWYSRPDPIHHRLRHAVRGGHGGR